MGGKLIIVEGIDGSGKTTLIEGLKTKMKIDYIFNYSYPKEPEMFQCGAFAKGEYMASIRIFRQLLAEGKTIVCDRFHIGEYAYGPVKRYYPYWFAEKIKTDVEEMLLKEIGKDRIFLIILLCSPWEALKRKGPDNYLEKDSSAFSRINERYSKVLSQLDFIRIDTSTWVYLDHPERVLEVTETLWL